MLSLKNVLKINGISSGATGVGLVGFSEFFAKIFSIEASLLFIDIGLFLILFSGLVLFTAFQKTIKIKLVKLIVLIDYLWVVASLFACLFFIDSISWIGHLLILGIAAWVALMAVLQNSKLKIRQNEELSKSI